MSIFGQVWLWSVAAFLVGVLLTWVLLVRPAQARSRALERRLQAAQAAASERQSMMNPAATRITEPEPARAPEPDFAPDFAPMTEHVQPLDEHQPGPAWLDRDSFGDRTPEVEEQAPEPEPEPAEESDAEKTSIFASFQKLEPDAASPFTADPEPEHGSLFAGDTDAEQRGSLFLSDPEPEHGSLPGSLFEPEPEPEHRYEPEPEPSYGSHAAVEEEPPAYAFGGEPEPPVEATETTAILPKRQPRATPPSSFEPPRPSVRSIERREPVADEGGRSGSLFEPSVRPNSGGAHAAPESSAPPPARTHASDDGTPPGPFGPGSAMPRPGGGRPSEDYTVKASVTALRYCTAHSPQYGRMVAEVWFRSVEDAERVGFRPLSS
ncbi:hypothetical protein [Amycolatopsis sp. GM8]|uniref:sunset domain-containing protein n=1 Tax=Amycolatopsis sp. GM8 TaxID=2896530 RepID=UPI001F2D837F|nr:hypothetical protein [Amycolatopsis sp. GM8]